MTINESDVRRAAALAALDVDDEEVARLTGQLAEILEYCARVAEVAVPEKAPGGGNGTPLRDDVARPFDPPIDISLLSSHVRNGLFTAQRPGGLTEE